MCNADSTEFVTQTLVEQVVAKVGDAREFAIFGWLTGMLQQVVHGVIVEVWNHSLQNCTELRNRQGPLSEGM